MTEEGKKAGGFAAFVPGLILCLGIAAAAVALQRVEESLAGRAWVEAVVLAILLGAVVRTAWTPGPRYDPGIGFSGKLLLEIAIVLLGASLSFAAVAQAGPVLLFGVAAIVVVALLASYGLGRFFGLSPRMSMLIACGNSICGNSAIAAVAPVIGAKPHDVASAISFTAVLGIATVLLLPYLGAAIGLDEYGYGVLAGLTVYAVPQVLAATMPVGAVATQIGTLVKLLRVLMLGPMVLVLSLMAFGETDREGPRRIPGLHKLVPWFIFGFLGLAAVRSYGLIPQTAVEATAAASKALTVIAMAALGLSVDLRAVAKAGPKVSAVVTLSLLVLGGISLGLIWTAGLAQ